MKVWEHVAYLMRWAPLWVWPVIAIVFLACNVAIGLLR